MSEQVSRSVGVALTLSVRGRVSREWLERVRQFVEATVADAVAKPGWLSTATLETPAKAEVEDCVAGVVGEDSWGSWECALAECLESGDDEGEGEQP